MMGMPFEGWKKKNRIWGGWVELSGLVWVSVDARGKLQLAAPHPLEKLVIVSGLQLPPSYSVVDVDSYSGDAVGPQRFHRLAFIRRGRNAG
ncbi:hypothetical protein F2Q69_00060166 [Brassica cretica]|uniref:Uncharacterized protein n=1 Tax=Brassica cretica TaxID=69181 RepID=A0A8S9RAE7_BRACR|nr:hypothetical protein F2Q69_00060166 [Brassica cretica]